MEENKFGHDQSHYERPNLPYRCGRGAMWQSPCNQGPQADGACGGTQECTPFLKSDRWECRREKRVLDQMGHVQSKDLHAPLEVLCGSYGAGW